MEMKTHKAKRLTPLQKGLIAGGVILFLLPLALYLPTMHGASPEAEVEKTFRNLVRFAEKRQHESMAAHVSDDYDGLVMDNRENLLKFTEHVFDNIEDLDVKILTLNVTMSDGGVAELDSAFEASGWWVGSSLYNRVPLSGGMPRPVGGRIRMRFRSEEGLWRMIHGEVEMEGYSSP